MTNIRILVADGNRQKALELADKLPQICTGCEITFADSFSRTISEITNRNFDTIFFGDILSDPMDREALAIHVSQNVRNPMVWIFHPAKEESKYFADKLNHSFIPTIIYDFGEELFRCVDFWYNEQR